MHSHIAAMAPGKPGLRRGRILVADDQPANLMLLYQLLSHEYELLAATGGEQALELCRQELPDLVLLDVVMPDVDGLEVCRRMKRDDDLAAIPVVFVTAGTSDTQENACWEAGGADFVHKPVNPNTLRRRVRSHLQLKWQFDALQALAFKDGLTGLANRRHVDERVAEEWRRCGRAAMSLAILMIDVDHFKRYNDHYGHQAGDACLMALAGALSGAINRPGDLVGRFGGEEFICVLPETDATGVGLIAGRVVAAVAALRMPHAASGVARFVTVSIGGAFTIPAGGEATKLVQQADAALYAAKSKGRAQVVVADALRDTAPAGA